MKPTLVTGASGFVGWHVARLLLERGHQVRALVRASSPIPELDVERVTGDLRDAASLGARPRDAASSSMSPRTIVSGRKILAELYQSNVEARATCLSAAQSRRRRTPRLHQHRRLHRHPSRRLIGDESQPVSLDDMAGAYKRSKFLAEQVALDFARGGFPVVIVNPTAPMGDHDFKPTPTGQIVLDFLNGAMPAYIDTGLNVVNVRDVALGHLLACEKGKIGRALHPRFRRT